MNADSTYSQTLKEYNINEREARRLQEAKDLTENDIEALEIEANEEGKKLLKKANENGKFAVNDTMSSPSPYTKTLQEYNIYFKEIY